MHALSSTLTLALRPVDNFGPIYLSFSPRDVVFAGWVGDLDSSWDGLAQGLKRMRLSSERKCAVLHLIVSSSASC